MDFMEYIKIKTMHKILEAFPFSKSEMASSSFDANGEHFSMTSLKYKNIELSITLKDKQGEEYIEHLCLKSNDESMNIDLRNIKKTEEFYIFLTTGFFNTLREKEEEDEY